MNFKLNISRQRILSLLLVTSLVSFFIRCTDNELTEVSSIVDGQSAVGDLVSISNSGFESGETGWIFVDPVSISGDFYKGSKSSKVTGSGGEFSQTVSVSANTDYTLSGYILESGTIGVTLGDTFVEESASNEDWAKVSVSFNSGSNTSVTIYGAYFEDEGRFDDFELAESGLTLADYIEIDSVDVDSVYADSVYADSVDVDSVDITPLTVVDILGDTWKVTVPYDKNGNDSGNVSDPDDRNNSAEDLFDLLEAAENHPEGFHVDGEEVIFTAHCGGATTSGSIYPRSELRQLDENGDDRYFSVEDYQYLDVTVRVLEVPVERPEVNMVQIHGPEDEPLRVEYSSGSQGLHMTINDKDGDYDDVIGYTLGDRLRVQVTVDQGKLTVVLTNLETGEIFDGVKGVEIEDKTGYFKVGCYLQSSITYCEAKNKSGYECTVDAPETKGTVAASDLKLISTW